MKKGQPDGPRERLFRSGAARLSDIDLVALLLGTGSMGTGVMALAARVLEAAGGLAGVARMGGGALCSVAGVGPTKAARIVAALELGRRASAPAPLRRGRVTSSRDVCRALAPLAFRAEEHFVAIALDAKFRVIAQLEIARGGLTACSLGPSDVFRALLREAAAAAIVVHNHPSGDASPSPQDLEFTARLVEAGQILGLRIVDHIIVGRDGHFSFVDAGLLPELSSSKSSS